MSRAWRTSTEAFERDASLVAKWAAQHMQEAATAPIWSACSPGDLLKSLPEACPSDPVDVETVLAELKSHIVPGLVRWDAPGWFAWFPSNAHPHALLGDLLASCLGQQGMLWLSSPACTEVEMRALSWLRQALGLPDRFDFDGVGGGVIQDTASSAVLSCLVAARDRATQGRARRDGVDSAAEPLTVYASGEAHSSVLKAVHIAGIGARQFRPVPVGPGQGMSAEAFKEQLEADMASGARPIFCCATVGSTGCGAIDEVEEIAEVCAAHDIWLHVDAAWAGTAAVSDAFRPSIIAGADRADSWCFNPHKWMGANFDCSCLWLADRRPLIDAMSVTPEYLRNDPTESGSVIDYRDWHVQLGRRFRALKIWLLLRCTGVKALGAMVEHHVELSKLLERRIASIANIELAAPRSLALVCLRHVDGDEATQRVLDAINQDGALAATHCRIDGAKAIRIAIGTLAVEQEHVDALARVIELSA
ncbi:MAG: pyridoxal-dependent decarboxylase [Phycisphaerales bacterium]|nr:pyridoxal-dependent decarboxylase [Phycisphaerales bacterium]